MTRIESQPILTTCCRSSTICSIMSGSIRRLEAKRRYRRPAARTASSLQLKTAATLVPSKTCPSFLNGSIEPTNRAHEATAAQASALRSSRSWWRRTRGRLAQILPGSASGSGSLYQLEFRCAFRGHNKDVTVFTISSTYLHLVLTFPG